MDATAKITPATSVAPVAASNDVAFKPSPAAQEAERSARYRLVIEEGPSAGTFVYKTLDRVTGEVVRQLPRESVVEMLKGDGYSAGAVIDTSA
jgi:flagellar protein FlaG